MFSIVKYDPKKPKAKAVAKIEYAKFIPTVDDFITELANR